MCGMKCLLVLALLMLIPAYYLYRPLPEQISEPMKTRIILATMDIMRDMSFACSALGIGSQVDCYRGILGFITKMKGFHHEGLDVTDTKFDGVPVRIYVSEEAKGDNLPAVVFFHGGGWYFGSIDTHDDFTAELARQSKAVVISVDYRLAPEHPYPAGLVDCLKVYQYFSIRARHYRVNKARIAVAGDSSGANLAAAVALKMQDNPRYPPIRAQILLVGVFQLADFRLPSHLQRPELMTHQKDIPFITLMYRGWGDRMDLVQDMTNNKHTTPELKKIVAQKLDLSLLPAKYKVNHKPTDIHGDFNKTLADELEMFIMDPMVSPLLAASFEGLPTAFVNVVDRDVVRDDGLLYGRKLEKAGVKVVYEVAEDTVHAHVNYVRILTRAMSILGNVVVFCEVNL